MAPCRWICRNPLAKISPQIQYKLLHFFALANAAEAADAKLQTLSRYFDWKGGWVAAGMTQITPGFEVLALPF